MVSGNGKQGRNGEREKVWLTPKFPLPAGPEEVEIVEGAFGLDLPKKMSGFGPELILVSAGFDSLEEVTHSDNWLQDEDFANLAKTRRRACKRIL